MEDNSRADVIVVGGGLLGLAHAYCAVRAGLEVIVLERSRTAQGASLRNHGLIWPIGQPHGKGRDLALRSREIWIDLANEVGLWLQRNGSLHLAYHQDEWDVLEEFIELESGDENYELLPRKAARLMSPVIREDGLIGGLWSPQECVVDPRELVQKLSLYLRDSLNVKFRFDTPVVGIKPPVVETRRGSLTADQIIVALGTNLGEFYPAIVQSEELQFCKLQMMRSGEIDGSWEIGPSLCAGLSLTQEPSFLHCPSVERVDRRYAEEMPEMVRFGIQGKITQDPSGRMLMGHSFQCGPEADPFNNEDINWAILRYLVTFVELPTTEISERWQGNFLSHPQRKFGIHRPEEGVTVISGLGGQGNTLAFGIAEKVIEDL